MSGVMSSLLRRCRAPLRPSAGLVVVGVAAAVAQPLIGGAGNDSLRVGSGRDVVQGGPGGDAISAVDKNRDTIDRGLGRDRVRADRIDRLRTCEQKSFPRRASRR